MRRWMTIGVRRVTYLVCVQLFVFILLVYIMITAEVFTQGIRSYLIYSTFFVLLMGSNIVFVIHLLKHTDLTEIVKCREAINKDITPIIERIRRSQHEYAHIITGLQLDKDIYKKLERYCEGETLLEELYQKHPTIVAAIYNKCEKGLNYDLIPSFSCHIKDLSLWNVALKDYEVVEIITNLTDNSIDALKKLRGEANRRFHIMIQLDKTQVLIKVGNSHNTICEELVTRWSEEGYTTKYKAETHGYGLYTVKELCERYQGELSTEINQDISYVVVTLPSNNEEVGK